MRMDQSQELFARAQRVMPGGVSSPVRAFRAVGGTPVYYRQASGAHFLDADGNRYLDYVMSWGPLILGHAHPAVVNAVQKAAALGLSYGAPCEGEVLLAEKIVALHPSCEMVRFVSSGTEAVMSALRLARGATGRARVLKFDACYHGHHDSLLVKAGSGLATFGTPSSAGVPAALAELTSVVPLDDDAALETAFASVGDEIAAAVIEAVPANAGLLLQRKAFLEKLQALCKRHGALFVVDEVISGFRLGPGGATAHYGLAPDLVTFGKVIGGGMPVGAYGGRRELMEQVAPLGAVYQAGTLSGNPVAMAAGLETLRVLEDEHGWERIEGLGAALESALGEVLRRRSVEASLVRLGSIFWLSLQPPPAARRWDAVDPASAGRYAKLHRALLERGVYLAPSAFEVGFLSTVHTEADLSQTAEALDAALGAM